MTVYLDCAATTPIEPEVREAVLRQMADEVGNAGSGTHEFGIRARRAVERARQQVALALSAADDEVIFTSGATESNNLALLGLASLGERTGRRHVVSTAIEHRAVLQPLAELQRRGFSVTLVRPTRGGWIEASDVLTAVRADTLFVSLMHVNNETGVIQPVAEVAKLLGEHPAYFHVDAAQGFGSEMACLRHPRLDLISVSGHKVHAPQGVGALLMRRRGHVRAPLAPLMHGGGQERGLRPGTLPVHLVAGLGVAVEIAMRDAPKRAAACTAQRARALAALLPLGAVLHGDQRRVVCHILNLSFPGVDSEALILAWKGIIAVSKGSACASNDKDASSHVLRAMGVSTENLRGAVRLSWAHSTELVDWHRVGGALQRVT